MYEAGWGGGGGGGLRNRALESLATRLTHQAAAALLPPPGSGALRMLGPLSEIGARRSWANGRPCLPPSWPMAGRVGRLVEKDPRQENADI